jgi:hypothetical protein
MMNFFVSIDGAEDTSWTQHGNILLWSCESVKDVSCTKLDLGAGSLFCCLYNLKHKYQDGTQLLIKSSLPFPYMIYYWFLDFLVFRMLK